ncbi:hypothetical protein HAX54_001980 [Datura stramonium]|uniref:Uncharacterized protein n=1 Tax=Datura stramonium TaxID=4076 RepID=A0ABS8T5F7_DATST|nr:hypothetical protein [Datura stramonium]
MSQEYSSTPSTEGNQIPDNLILDTLISSNPLSFPSGTDTRNSPESKMSTDSHTPFNSSVISALTSHGDNNTVGQETWELPGSPFTSKEGVEGHAKESSDLSNETLFKGGLMESNDGISSILQSEAEIIKGFITALATREGEVGEKTPSAKVTYYIKEKSQGEDGKKRGPATRGTAKKSMDLILEESRQNNLKRCRVTKEMVIDEEDPYSPVVDLDAEVPPQTMKESPEIGKNSLRSAKIPTKGK